VGCGEARLEAAEAVIRAGMLRAGCGMLGRLLAADPGYRGPRVPCGQGHEAEFVSCRDKIIDTVLGPVTLTRAWYHCAACKHGLAPRDAELGVQDASMSPGLRAMNDQAAAAGPFAKAARLLENLAGVRLVAAVSLDQMTAPDVVVIGSTLSTREPDQAVVQWLRRVHPATTWTTSVCTGSIYLAAAGILDGQDATTHWARAGELERRGARYTEQRVVERGKVITAAGVSAGIDMALTLLARLHGPELAQIVQLGIEYDPHPPFDAGSPSKAPTEIVEYLRAQLSAPEASASASTS